MNVVTRFSVPSVFGQFVEPLIELAGNVETEGTVVTTASKLGTVVDPLSLFPIWDTPKSATTSTGMPIPKTSPRLRTLESFC